MSWLTDSNFIQMGHGAAGYGLALTPTLWGASWYHFGLGVALVAAWTFPKEYLFDIYVEGQTYADGWIDQRSYLLGAAVAGLMFLIRLR